MKKAFSIVVIFSLVMFSGCSLFSGRNSTNEQQDASKVEDTVVPQTEAQNEPVQNVMPDTASIRAEAEKLSQPQATSATESAEAKLAKCLTAKGAKLFTSSTCPHCTVQKELFKDGLQYLDNTECLAMDGWSKVCTDNAVDAVPTWIFADGQRLTGTTPLEGLATKTGCEYTPAVATAS